MAYLYLTAHEPAPFKQFANELIAEGVAKRRIRVITTDPEQATGLPVKTLRYRPPVSNLLFGALMGGLIGLPLLWFGEFGLAPMLVLVVAAGVGGGLSRLWFGHGLAGEVYSLDDALRRGDLAMVLKVDERRLGSAERTVKDRHPEVAVLGADPRGTPPFP